MKKAKLMLSAIAIIGILGTAFALNTHKYDTRYIYTGVTGTSSTACQTQVSPVNISTSCFPPNVYASTSSLSSNCPLTCTVAVMTGD